MEPLPLLPSGPGGVCSPPLRKTQLSTPSASSSPDGYPEQLSIHLKDRKNKKTWRRGRGVGLRSSASLPPLSGPALSLPGASMRPHPRLSLGVQAPSNPKYVFWIKLGGEGGIRTPGRVLPLQLLSRQLPSATRPPLQRVLRTLRDGAIKRGFICITASCYNQGRF